jgi:hypothetical protein
VEIGTKNPGSTRPGVWSRPRWWRSRVQRFKGSKVKRFNGKFQIDNPERGTLNWEPFYGFKGSWENRIDFNPSTQNPEI